MTDTRDPLDIDEEHVLNAVRGAIPHQIVVDRFAELRRLHQRLEERTAQWARQAPVPAHRRFVLDRLKDPTGVSGTGIVAWGVMFPDGTACLRWNTRYRSTVFYEDMRVVEKIHGHLGDTLIVWLDELETVTPVRPHGVDVG